MLRVEDMGSCKPIAFMINHEDEKAVGNNTSSQDITASAVKTQPEEGGLHNLKAPVTLKFAKWETLIGETTWVK